MRTFGMLLACLIALLVSPAHGTSLCFVDTGSGQIMTEATPQPDGSVVYDDFDSAWTGFDAGGTPCSFATCGPGERSYRWTISLSDTDPSVSSATLAPGPVSLYLWLECANPQPTAVPIVGTLHVQTSGDLYIVGYLPENGAPNVGTFTDPQILLGQLWNNNGGAPLLVGTWPCWVDSPVAVDEPSWSRVKAMYH